MGFFDRSSSKSTTNYSEETNTTTSTKIGDVGLTGQNIVDFFNINAKQNADIAGSLSSVTKDVSQGFQLYAGGLETATQGAISTSEKSLLSDNVKNFGIVITIIGVGVIIYKKVLK